MGDLYIFADGLVFGLTPCAPILNFPESEFIAALCMDLNPSGTLTQYYPFEEDDQASYMLFNTNSDGEADYGKDSQFRQFLTQIIE